MAAAAILDIVCMLFGYCRYDVMSLHTDEQTDDRRQRCQDAVQHSFCEAKTTKSGFGYQDRFRSTV